MSYPSDWRSADLSERDVYNLVTRLTTLEDALSPKTQPLIFPDFQESRLRTRRHKANIQPHSVYEVLQTPELLEAILSALPPLDLLRCTQVSSYFQSTIKGSIILKRVLFMAPESAAGEGGTNSNAPLPRINNLLRRKNKMRSRASRIPTDSALQSGVFVLDS
jgi:hypothetical protein